SGSSSAFPVGQTVGRIPLLIQLRHPSSMITPHLIEPLRALRMGLSLTPHDALGFFFIAIIAATAQISTRTEIWTITVVIAPTTAQRTNPIIVVRIALDEWRSRLLTVIRFVFRVARIASTAHRPVLLSGFFGLGEPLCNAAAALDTIIIKVGLGDFPI